MDSCASCLSRRQILTGGAALAAAAVVGSAPSAEAATATDIGPATSVAVGKGKVFTVKGKPLVVTQPKKGTYKAFSGSCTHQGCAVTGVVNKRIECPCHGARFDFNTGKPVAGPARLGLKSYKVTVKKGRLIVQL